MPDNSEKSRESPYRWLTPGQNYLALSGLERMRSAVKDACDRRRSANLIACDRSSWRRWLTFSTPASALALLQACTRVGVGALVSDAALGASDLCGASRGGLATRSSRSTSSVSRPVSGKLTARGRLIHATPRSVCRGVHRDGNGRLLRTHSRCFLQRSSTGGLSEAHTTQSRSPSFQRPTLIPAAGSKASSYLRARG